MTYARAARDATWARRERFLSRAAVHGRTRTACRRLAIIARMLSGRNIHSASSGIAISRAVMRRRCSSICSSGGRRRISSRSSAAASADRGFAMGHDRANLRRVEFPGSLAEEGLTVRRFIGEEVVRWTGRSVGRHGSPAENLLLVLYGGGIWLLVAKVGVAG